MWIEFVFPYD